jgi:hypothetical protein
MSHQGKQHLTIVFKATTPELVAEGDRIFESHAAWMEASHPQEGELALLLYNVSKGPEFTKPLEPAAGTTGSVFFVLTEVYATEAGVANHWKMGSETWADFNAMVQWMEECETSVIHGCPVVHSLW